MKTLPEWQRHELDLKLSNLKSEDVEPGTEMESVATFLLQHADEFVAILSQVKVGRPRGSGKGSKKTPAIAASKEAA